MEKITERVELFVSNDIAEGNSVLKRNWSKNLHKSDASSSQGQVIKDVLKAHYELKPIHTAEVTIFNEDSKDQEKASWNMLSSYMDRLSTHCKFDGYLHGGWIASSTRVWSEEREHWEKVTDSGGSHF